MKRNLLFFIFSLLVSSTVMASDFFTDFPQHRYRIITATYTPADWPQSLKADLYLPTAVTGKPRPLVLLVHGGSWQRGNRGHMSRIARALAIAGYAAFSIDYRLAPQFRHPAQLEDMQQALRYLQEHAAEYGLDMQQTAAWGFSAGAHLVSLLAVQPPLDGQAPLRAVIAGGTPADLRIYPDSPAVKALLGARPAEAPALYAEASPLARVRPGLPAFFLYHGDKDDLVIPAQARNFAEALQASGVPVQLLWLKDYGHMRTALFLGKTLPAGLLFLQQQIPLQTP
ncbi:MAG: alpha/beta hydrolase [Pedobacter sp.]|nr:alpha/beta hydrolase [Pedobacter sp.]